MSLIGAAAGAAMSRKLRLELLRKKKADFKGSRLSIRQRKQVKRLISGQIELKHFPVYNNVSVTTTSYNMQVLTAIPQGNTDITRVGDEVMFKGFSSNLELIPGDVYNNIRIVIFQWRQDNNAYAPTMSDVLDNVSSGSVYPPFYQLNFANREKYHILYDRTVSLNPVTAFTSAAALGSAYAQTGVRHLKIRIRPSRMKKTIKFNANATTGVGHLYQLLVSDSAITPNPVVNYAGQVTYSDG